ncbi:DNA polymerase subunit gamma-1 isoform X2 [Lingula anatina]|uniref:DNA polymerase subunit gamma-1 isoform X2 n=1 Tax=Lingula anatina TaxID=7574 RepID=A0A1S3IA14_LINAN|nr:DNA polymerase subunit gamma-1 isoform X2 [Lingula anatina]|eukprot:XP_013395097.1 DNA polymerase subunit gamma-1 isoform X2 [Lingula anatina]
MQQKKMKCALIQLEFRCYPNPYTDKYLKKMQMVIPKTRAQKMKDIEKHLKSHDLWDKETTVVPEVNFDLPKLYGSNIDEHFKIIAEKQCAGYRKKADILTTGSLPYKPQTWAETQGWTRYNADGSTTRVEFPDEDSLVFDVEVLVPESDMPVLATAASPNHWYSWCNQHLIKSDAQGFFKMTPDELIPLDMDQGGWKEKVVVGHNVGFDRSFVKEQYLIKGPKTRFMDTMSMHIAVSGFTGSQRMLWNAKKTGSKSKSILELEERNKRLNKLPVFEWMEDGAPNNLSDVYQHYCQGAPLDKEVREVFLEGTTYELGLNIQNLMSYCADDVIATHQVFQILWPLFQERFPHPVTLAGMLQMGSSYLPLNANWNRYLETAEEIYNNKQSERERMLIKIANDACSLLEGNRYKEDPWLWDLDWSIQNLRIKKTPLSAKKKAKSDKTEETTVDIVSKVLSTKNLLYKVSAHMPGYPLWFKKFCPKLGEVPWSYGPTLITMRKNDTPKLMRMTWKGFPVHFDDNLGWGYLVPGRMDNLDVLQGEDEPKFPLK